MASKSCKEESQDDSQDFDGTDLRIEKISGRGGVERYSITKSRCWLRARVIVLL